MQIFYLILKILVLIKQIESAKRSNLDKDIPEDAYLDTHQLIAKYKYKAETHFVQTEDGYILRMHRIAKPNGQPFFLMHGLFDTSATYVLPGPNNGLGYYLADLGYDIWIGNTRGNVYSRNHTKLDPNTDGIFWNFSWHEIGIYDLPAMIDYVLNFTKFEKLLYVGHSQGTTSFFVMCSKRPEYNKKIILMQALAPSAFLANVKSPFKIVVNPFGTNLLKTQYSKFFPEVFVPGANILIPFCKTFTSICIDIIFLIMGPSPKQFNVSMLPIIVGHAPSQCATKQLEHYLQLIVSKRFCEFDFGQRENMKKYGKIIPPKYDISKITAPIFLYYSLTDYMTSEKDVEILSSILPNVQGKYLVKSQKWNHVDFIWGIDAREIIYKKIGIQANKLLNN